MISSLKNNSFHNITGLRGKLNISIIKKEAVLRLPKNFRVADPKINPRSDHMVWASVLLDDKDLFELTSSLFLTDLSMNPTTHSSTEKPHDELIADSLAQLINTTQDPTLITTLSQRIRKWRI